jgi:hypothetical protein
MIKSNMGAGVGRLEYGKPQDAPTWRTPQHRSNTRMKTFATTPPGFAERKESVRTLSHLLTRLFNRA